MLVGASNLEKGPSDYEIFANLRLNFEALFNMQHVGAGGQVFPITGTHAYNFPDAIIAPELESSIDQSSFSSYQPVAGAELNNNIYRTATL